MSETEIPADIRAIADDLSGWTYETQDEVSDAIARALLAVQAEERERCARIAEDPELTVPNNNKVSLVDVYGWPRAIARAIRSGQRSGE